ncbi:GSCOCG00010130001-RA-CDS [Cotesia congregata]|nr:GSCOCG00010130001-RA-CDS [Cotesia congregata]
MGIQDFQTFLDSNCIPGGAVTVDLLKIARQVIQRQRNRLNKAQSSHPPLLRLVLDAECCLDRLYGGYFSDWACGGQWNRMLQFLAILIQATELSGADLVVFFNGCNEVPRRSEWIQQQLQMRNKVNNVLKHIATKGTPPPKIWWTPPVCLRTSLRMALRHLKVSVMCSMDDHHQEVIAYCRENNFNGLVADDGEYAAFDPPRYFSSEQLKLTYKGSLDTKEYLMSENCAMGTSRFASETAESERESLDAYNQATANAKAAPQIVIEPPQQSQGDGDVKTDDEQPATEPAVNGTHSNLSTSSPNSNGSSSVTSPSHPTTGQTKVADKPVSIPTTVPEVMRTASERHQKGLMSPHIYQILATGEIKLPVLLEDENQREFPSIHIIYRPVRQMVYAILFNLHHQIFMATKNKEKGDEKIEVPDIVIKEWVWSKTNPYQTPELIKAEQIGWDKRRRLRGFLTCMKSDTSLMLNISYVPQHLLVMACVLRYIMYFSDKTKILRRQELDAFIVQAFSPDLMNPQYLQDLQVLNKTPKIIFEFSCALNDTQNRARVNRPVNVLQRELIRRPVPSRGGQLEIAGVVVGQWGANYGQPGRIQGPQPIQGHLRGRLPQQLQIVDALVPFPRLNTRMFQPRGGNNSIATRGKKTQMKATSKKKSAVKKNQENDMKKDSKNRDNSVDEVNADAFSKLLVKDVNAKEKTESNQQTESAVNGGGKPVEKGQGDASLNVSQTVKDN